MTTMARESALHIMDHTGDNRILWSTDKPDSVSIAQAAFDAAKEKGYLAYTVDEKGEKGEVIHTFDPQAGAIIMAPQLVGG